MINISKTKKAHFILIILGFILPVSRTVFMEIPKIVGQLLSQIFTQILFEKSTSSFNWITLISIISIVSLLFHLFSFVSIVIEKSEKNMRSYTISTLVYVISGTVFLYNQTPDLFFVAIVYYLFLMIGTFFVKNF